MSVEAHPLTLPAVQSLLSCRQAVLATHSASLPGFPFTSVVPVVVLTDGRLITLLSEIAQHTRHVSLDNRVSLLLHDDQLLDWQAAARLTVVGRLLPVQEADPQVLAQIRAQFFRVHAALTDFDHQLDFSFWQLDAMRFRFVGGFAQVKWFDQLQPDLIELDAEQRASLEQLLMTQLGKGRLLNLSQHGVQWLADSGRLLWQPLRTLPPEPAQAVQLLLTDWQGWQLPTVAPSAGDI